MATEGAANVVLHRGIHLFTHPVLIYGYIDMLPPKFLRRTLSYVGRPAPTVELKSGTTAPGSAAALVVRVGDAALAGENLPNQVTFVVVLCEAASTGRDFKPLRAAAVTVPGRDAAAEAAPAAASAAAGMGTPGASAPGSARGAAATPKRNHEPLLLPLPKRRMTRPVLLLLASAWHPDMKALVPPGGSARRLRTDLRCGGGLLGLLPELGPVWVAMQPLEGVLGSDSGGSTSDIGQSAVAATVAAGSSGVGSPPPMRMQALLRRGRIARSRCSVVGPSGATLSTVLLNLDLDPDPDPGPASVVGPGRDTDPAPTARPPRRLYGSSSGASEQPVARMQSLEQRQRHKVSRTGSAGEVGVARSRSREAASRGVTAQAAEGGRLTRSSGGVDGGSGVGSGDGGGVGRVEEVQVVRLTSLEVGWELGLEARQVARGGDGAAPRSRNPSDVTAATATVARPTATAAERAVVEFRYVYDASWCGGPTAAAAGTSRTRQKQQQLEQQQHQQLLRAEQQLLELQRLGEGQQQQRRSVGGVGVVVESASLRTHGSGNENPAPDADKQAAAAEGEGGLTGGGADRATWMKQQMSMALGSEPVSEARQQQQQGLAGAQLARGPERARERKRNSDSGEGSGERAEMAAQGAGGLVERYFTEEVVEGASGGFRCPMCTKGLACWGVKGLQLHLLASHSLYSYKLLDVDEGPGGEEPGGREGGDNGAGNGGGGGERRRRYVVEVRLPADAVDPARHDLVLPCEDLVLLSSDGAITQRPWCYSRRAGMTRPVYTDAAALEALAAGQAAAAGQQGQLPAPPMPPGRNTGRGRGERGTAATAAPSAAGAGAGKGDGGRGTGAGLRPPRSLPGQVPEHVPPAPSAGAAGGAAGRGESGGSGSGQAGAPALVRVPLESLRRSAAGAEVPPPEAGAAAEAGAALPPSALAPGVHPPGRRYYHSRSAVPGTVEELFGAYDSDDETDEEEWEATFDRHVITTTRITPLRAADRRFFKLWSAFARRRPVYADFVTRSRCLEFSRLHGELIRSDRELRAAMVVHLLLLHEMNLVDARLIQRCLLIVDGRIISTAEEDERFLATRGTEVGSRGAATAATAAGAAARGSGGGAATGGDDDDGDEGLPPGGGGAGGGAAGGGTADGSSGDGGSGSGDDGEGVGGEGGDDGGEQGGGGRGGPCDGCDGVRVAAGGGGGRQQRRGREVPRHQAVPRRRRGGSLDEPEAKRCRRHPPKAGGEAAGGDVVTAAGGVRRGPAAAASAAATERDLPLEGQEGEAGRAEAAAGAAMEGRGREDEAPGDAPTVAPRPGGCETTESAGVGTGAQAAAVETGAVEAEGGTPSPEGAAAPLAQRAGPQQAAPPPPQPQQQMLLRHSSRPDPPLGHSQQEQVRQGDPQQLPSSWSRGPPQLPRPCPALSWSLNKKASRALAAPAALQPQQPRPLSGLHGRAGAPVAAAAAAPGAAGAGGALNGVTGR